MTKKLDFRKVLLAALLPCMIAPSTQAESAALPHPPQWRAEGVAANPVVREYNAQQASADLAAAPIRKAADVEAFIAANPVSPLSALSAMDRKLFLDSLTYNEGGVTSFRFDVLQALTPSQAYKILALIGMQGFVPNLRSGSETATDRKIMAATPSPSILVGYYCKSQGTCWVANDRACSGGC